MGFDTTLSLPSLFIPKRDGLLSPNRRLLKNEIWYIYLRVRLQLRQSPLLFSLNLILCMYIYNRGFIPLQKHVPDDIKIYQLLRAVIESYAPHFADGSIGPGHSIDYPVRVVLWPATRKFRNVL